MKRLFFLFAAVLLSSSLLMAGGTKTYHRTHTVYVDLDTNAVSTETDTIKSIMTLVYDHLAFNRVYARIVLDTSETTTGYGEADSAILWLWTVFANDIRANVDSQICATLPCTLLVNDTTLQGTLLERLDIRWYVSDTLTDTLNVLGSVAHPLKVDILLQDN